MRNEMILKGRILLVVVIMLSVIFTGCNISNQISTEGTENKTEEDFGVESENTTLGGEVMDEESVTESEADTEIENNEDTEADVNDTETSEDTATNSTGSENTSSSNPTTGNSNSSSGTTSGGNSGKVDVSDIELADGECIMYAVSAVYVRSMKTTDSYILGTLSEGEAVVVVDKSLGGWYKVKYGSGYGYVGKKYLNAYKIDMNESAGNDEYQSDIQGVIELAQQILNSIIKPSMSDFEKILAIHDWLTHNVEYDYDNYLNGTIPLESYTELGALRDKKAVCGGYAAAFQLMARMAGFEAKTVEGIAFNLLGAGPHAWNQVKLNGIWYNVDVTWDDPVTSDEEISNCNYDYFLVSNAYLYEDHTPFSEAENCLYTYDRRTVFKTAIQSGSYGNNIAFVESAEEATAAINAFGKADISKIEIWIYYPSGRGYEQLFEGMEAASYPYINTVSCSGSGDFYKYSIEIMTNKDIGHLPVVTSGKEYVELINAMFDTGITSFRYISDHSGNPDNAFIYSSWDLKYEYKSEIIEGYYYGRCFVNEVTLIGKKEM